MATKKKKPAAQPELIEPVSVTLRVTDWRHLARVLVHSGKAAPGMRAKLVTFAAMVMESCKSREDVTENVTIRDARTMWCDLTHSLTITGLCSDIAREITTQIPV